MPSIKCLHILYTNKNINTNTCCQNVISSMCIYLYNNTDINTNNCCQNDQSYMCIHPLQQHRRNTQRLFARNSHWYMCTYNMHQHKHKQKRIIKKCPVLHVYIPYTTTQTYTKRFVAKITSLTCIHTLYNNKKINTNSHCHIYESYMCTILFKKNIRTNALCQKCPVLHAYIPSTKTQT